MRRLLVAAAALLAASGVAAGNVRNASACDQSSCLPYLSGATPTQVVLNGRPLHITLEGANLSDVTAVLIAPITPLQGFQVFNDTTVLVTLPASTAPGTYAVRVQTADGSSDPSMAPQFVVFPAVPPTEAPTPRPRPTATPRPTPTPMPPLPDSGILAAVGAVVAPPPPGGAPPASSGGSDITAPMSPASVPIDVMAGLGLGALLFLLWGSPRRLHGSWRSAPLLHLLGRPAQALRVGRICLYCGRLHFVFSTRRDLWREGRYCRARCFIAAEAQPSPLPDSDGDADAPPPPSLAWRVRAR